MTSANSKQVGGSHYRSAHQHWDYMAALYGDHHFKAAATKYIMRWRKKNGTEDLRKAQHYMEKLLELVQQGDVVLELPKVSDALIVASNDMNAYDAALFHAVMYAMNTDDLKNIINSIDTELSSSAMVPV